MQCHVRVEVIAGRARRRWRRSGMDNLWTISFIYRGVTRLADFVEQVSRLKMLST